MSDEGEHKNSVKLNPDGYLEIALVGDQTDITFMELYAESQPLIDKLSAEHKPLKCLFDMSRESGFSLSSNKAAMSILEQVSYEKIAMYQVPHAEVTKGIIMAIGKADTTKLFKTREEALAWLLS